MNPNPPQENRDFRTLEQEADRLEREGKSEEEIEAYVREKLSELLLFDHPPPP